MLIFSALFACVNETSVVDKDPVAGTDCEPYVAYADVDGDGWGGGEPIAGCGTLASGQVLDDGDCDDADPSLHPDALELCDGVDQDCDAQVDEDLPVLSWFEDVDGDGAPGTETFGCEIPSGAATAADDCDDNNAQIAPGMAELCDGIDQDCDGTVDEEAIDAPTWYADSDGDSYGVVSPTVVTCEQPAGFADNPDDCDDADATHGLECPTPASPVAACLGGYTPYTWSDPAATEPELHLLGAYEPNPGTGQILVDVQRGTRMTLHLSAYTATEWTVSNSGGATIDAILVSGYDAQVVNAPVGVPVEIRTAVTTGSSFGYVCGYSYPYAGGGCDTDAVIRGVTAYTGLAMSSFAGCYQASGFTVR